MFWAVVFIIIKEMIDLLGKLKMKSITNMVIIFVSIKVHSLALCPNTNGWNN